MSLRPGPAALTASGSPASAYRDARHLQRPVGRPSLLTPERHVRITTAISDGVPYETIAAVEEINAASVRTWVDRGRVDNDNGIESIFSVFYVDVKKAEAIFEEKLARKWAKIVTEPTTKRKQVFKGSVDPITGEHIMYLESETIDETGDGDWRGIAEYLARRFPTRWMRTERVEQSGVDGKPIEVRNSALPIEMDKVSVDMKRRVIKLLEEIAEAAAVSAADIIDAEIAELDDDDQVADMPIPERYRVNIKLPSD